MAFEVEIEPTATVLELKQKIADTYGLAAKDQILLAGGNPMLDEKTVFECGVKKCGVTHLVFGPGARVPSSFGTEAASSAKSDEPARQPSTAAVRVHMINTEFEGLLASKRQAHANHRFKLLSWIVGERSDGYAAFTNPEKAQVAALKVEIIHLAQENPDDTDLQVMLLPNANGVCQSSIVDFQMTNRSILQSSETTTRCEINTVYRAQDASNKVTCCVLPR